MNKDSHREYTNNYIWRRFKQHWLTLSGLLLPSLSSIYMMISDLAVNLQIVNILMLVGMVGISYWWHWFYNIENLAKEGVNEFMNMKEQERETHLVERFSEVDLSLFPNYKKLYDDLEENYNDFLKALNSQKIITQKAHYDFKTKAENVFNTGIDILIEISDVLVVQNSVNIDEYKKFENSPKEEQKAFRAVIDAYNNNEKKLKRLSNSLKDLSNSYVLGISHLASVTSQTNQKEDIFGESELKMAIEAAKNVQDKLYGLSHENEMQDIFNRYTKE